MRATSPMEFADRLRSGDRSALARAITMVESTRSDHREQAMALLDAVLPDTGNALRVAITGTPGAGKSTFIESLGMRLTAQTHRVAVLAIDPSSRRSGGSILGDKTRMERLARERNAFIRPSPSAGTLGGVARRTREVSLLCEAAGFDTIVIETVGIGQSEVVAADMVDCFLLIVAPAGGDDLQGIKRGIMELADVVVVNKADGDLAAAAHRTTSDLTHALHLLRPKHDGWEVPVIEASAIEGRGIEEAWKSVASLADMLVRSRALAPHRSEQAVIWMWEEINERLLRSFAEEPLRARVAEIERDVRAGAISATSAAAAVLALVAADVPASDARGRAL